MNDVMLYDFFKNFFLAIHPILLPKQWKKWIQLWSITLTHTQRHRTVHYQHEVVLFGSIFLHWSEKMIL